MTGRPERSAGALPEPSIGALPERAAALPPPERAAFERIYRVVRTSGSLVPPSEMEAWIERSFGSVEVVRSQNVVKVLNRWTLEGTLFNDLRARRPVEGRGEPGAGGADVGAGADPFCTPLTGTPADTFGRIEGGYTITASNVAKYDGLHGVVIKREHDPLSWSEEEVADAFRTAMRWLVAVRAAQPSAPYPFVMWNCLPRSGASIVHAHMQVTLGEGSAYARVEAWRRAAAGYGAEVRGKAKGERRKGSSDGSEGHASLPPFPFPLSPFPVEALGPYFEDLWAVHRALGLGGERGGVRWLAHLTPLKEKEVVLLAPSPADELYAEVHRLVRLYLDRLGVRAFNLAMYLPPLVPVEEEWGGFPVVVRLVDRGDPGSATSDIGAMELFAQPVVAADPWKVAAAVRDA